MLTKHHAPAALVALRHRLAPERPRVVLELVGRAHQDTERDEEVGVGVKGTDGESKRDAQVAGCEDLGFDGSQRIARRRRERER